MANKVSFIIQLKDQFKRNARAVKAQFRDIAKSANEASNKVQRFSNKTKVALISLKKNAGLAGAALTASLTVPILRSGKGMIDLAGTAEETANRFSVVFDGINRDANQVADSLTKGLGLARSTTQGLLADSADLLSGLGLEQKQTLELSKAIVQRSADVASFKDVQGGAERTTKAFIKALLGEREMLKDTFKISVLEKDVIAEANKLRYKNRYLTEKQAKALAGFNLIMLQSENAAGDLANTWNSYNNVVRRSEERTREMKEAFGRLLLPFATKVLIKVTQLVNWINELSPGMKKFILIVGGLVAVAGPLLLIVAGIGAAFAFISAPVALVTAGIIAITAAIGALVAKWESVKGMFSKVASFFGNAAVSPLGVPMVRGGTVDGNITVSAAPGTTVESTSMSNKGEGLNLGMNMATAR